MKNNEKMNSEKNITILITRIRHMAVVRNRNIIYDEIIASRFNLLEHEIRQELSRLYDDEQLEYIIEHLPEMTETENSFILQDPDDQYICDVLNNQLNALVPNFP